MTDKEILGQEAKPTSARWYIVYVHSGCERAVVKRLEDKIKKQKLEDAFEEILIPTQEATEIKLGKKVKVERKFFPGYVLIRMIMNNDTWHMVRDIPLVSGFLGSRTKPSPITEVEANNLIRRLENTEESFVSDIRFEAGEQVRVNDGPFASFNGIIEKVEEDKQRLKVSVSIFGRPTQVELDYSQVEKI